MKTANIFIFGFAMLKMVRKCDASFFDTHFLSISYCGTSRQVAFLNLRTKLDKIGMHLKENFEFQNLTFSDMN